MRKKKTQEHKDSSKIIHKSHLTSLSAGALKPETTQASKPKYNKKIILSIRAFRLHRFYARDRVSANLVPELNGS